MADWPGISYLRTTRGAYPVLYEATEAFPAGGSKVLRAGPQDAVTLVGAGVTLHACLAAADSLAATGTAARVIDLYSVKPVDSETLRLPPLPPAAGSLSRRPSPRRRLGSAVTDALLGTGQQPLRVEHLAVRGMPGSGTGAELMAAAGIDAAHIEAVARRLLEMR